MGDDDTERERGQRRNEITRVRRFFLLEALCTPNGIIDCSECRERNGRKGKEEEAAV